MTDAKKRLTTTAGIPVGDNQNSLTAGPRGPVLMQDFQLIEKMAHFNRERIPERVVHAKGAGAYGTFTVTHDITRYSQAQVFAAIGQKTEMFIRFSTVGGEKGSADSARDPRGFAMKFYTADGNWDLVGNNTPIFFIRDPLKFGFLAAWLGGELTGEWLPAMWTARFGADSLALRLGVAFLGGGLMAFGARMAGGCTSGHGISGTMQLSVGSWVAVVCFFVGGIATALLMFRV